MSHIKIAALLGLSAVLSSGVFAQNLPQAASSPAIPSSIVSEHRTLHVQLAKAVRAGGQTGAAAKQVEKLLALHFDKEERFAMPPLGLLSGLAAGSKPIDPARVIEMTERLKAEMPAMLSEHQAIGAAVQRLRTAARNERKHEAEQFADALMAHAMQEEQILYPSAILVGEYLKLTPATGTAR
jgi:hypothetical protein